VGNEKRFEQLRFAEKVDFCGSKASRGEADGWSATWRMPVSTKRVAVRLYHARPGRQRFNSGVSPGAGVDGPALPHRQSYGAENNGETACDNVDG